MAAQERIRIADENNKSRMASQVLKAQMKLEAKIEDIKNERDRKKLERYIDANVLHMADLYDTFLFLLADAELTVLDTIDAISEYDERFGAVAEQE